MMGLDMYLETKEGEEVMYWRKANAIHSWFVTNCGNRKKDTDIKVTNGDLRKLLNDINDVLNTKKLATERLPTMTGFFFGSDDFDECYYEDLIETKNMIEKVLKEIDFGEKETSMEINCILKNGDTEFIYISSY